MAIWVRRKYTVLTIKYKGKKVFVVAKGFHVIFPCYGIRRNDNTQKNVFFYNHKKYVYTKIFCQRRKVQISKILILFKKILKIKIKQKKSEFQEHGY